MPSQTTTSVPAQTPWYAKAWFTIVMLILLAPVGWFLLWKYRTWSTGMKILATGLSFLFFVSAMSSKPKQDVASNQNDTTRVASADPVTSSPKAPRSTRASNPAQQKSTAPASRSEKASSSSQASKPADAPAKAVTQETPNEEPTSSNVSVQEIEGLGTREVGVVDDVQYVVAKAERMNSISGTQADGTFIVLRVLAKNTDKKTHDVNTSLMKLLDNQDREFDPSSNGGTALALSGDQSAELFMAQVQPGTTKPFSVVYDAPEDAKGLKFKIPGGMFSSSGEAIIKVP